MKIRFCPSLRFYSHNSLLFLLIANQNFSFLWKPSPHPRPNILCTKILSPEILCQWLHVCCWRDHIHLDCHQRTLNYLFSSLKCTVSVISSSISVLSVNLRVRPNPSLPDEAAMVPTMSSSSWSVALEILQSDVITSTASTFQTSSFEEDDLCDSLMLR